MNKERRKSLKKIIDQIDELKNRLEELQSDEEEYRDNMPDNLQGCERYEKAEAAVSNIEDAISSLEDVICSIEEAIEQ